MVLSHLFTAVVGANEEVVLSNLFTAVVRANEEVTVVPPCLWPSTLTLLLLHCEHVIFLALDIEQCWVFVIISHRLEGPKLQDQSPFN